MHQLTPWRRDERAHRVAALAASASLPRCLSEQSQRGMSLPVCATPPSYACAAPECEYCHGAAGGRRPRTARGTTHRSLGADSYHCCCRRCCCCIRHLGAWPALRRSTALHRGGRYVSASQSRRPALAAAAHFLGSFAALIQGGFRRLAQTHPPCPSRGPAWLE